MRSLTEGLESEAASKPAGGGGGGGGLRDTFNDLVSGPAGKVALVVLAVGMLAFFISRLTAQIGPVESTVLEPHVRMMNPETGEMLSYKVRIGGERPEGFYPVEYCWAEHPEAVGVPVILNEALYERGDPRRDEPTLCPLCESPVVGHNPKPEELFGLRPKDYETDEAPAEVAEAFREKLNKR